MALLFLEKKDLIAQIFEQYLDESIEDDLEILETVEQENISIMKGKLRERYDVSKVFSKTEDYEDKPLIKKVLCALINYAIVKRNKARKIPLSFSDEYKWAMQWLKDVKSGDETPAFPILEITRKEVKWGNNKNEEYYY
ncbi:MAG: phage protein Gp36 family protein [Flavobacterium circumlabens]|uniref:phage protein Gp36 family protein n=1 Tax=Flavobacterium circumlabens TaxID=2133765 RepID=UPI003263EAA1